MHTSLITTSRIVTSTEEIGQSTANQLADAMEMTGGNAIPLFVKNIGTIAQPQYTLINPTRQQLEVLAAVRVLRERNGAKWGNCTVMITNPTNNEGEVIDMTDAVLAQIDPNNNSLPVAPVVTESVESTETIITESVESTETTITESVESTKTAPVECPVEQLLQEVAQELRASQAAREAMARREQELREKVQQVLAKYPTR